MRTVYCRSEMLEGVETMTVTLNLKPEAEAKLAARARERGVPVETWLLDVVNIALEPSDLEMTADLQEDDLPILQPIATRRVSARLVYGGAFRFPSIDETDLVNLDD